MRLKVLFIGNSHTYLHHMPEMLQGLSEAEAREFSIYTAQSIGNGVSLEWHWKNSSTREMILGNAWDYVVLQERSGGPLEELRSFERHVRRFHKEIKKQGAETLLYLTWAKRSRPETQKILTDAYTKIAQELEIDLAPVGLAWQKASLEQPDADLYHNDGRHAGPAGAYLTACVFYALLFNTSPARLPAVFTIKGKRRVDLDESTAIFLQQIAFETVRKVKGFIQRDD